MFQNTLHRLPRRAMYIVVMALTALSGSAAKACTLALTDTTTIDVAAGTLTQHQTVRIERDRIAAVGPASALSVRDCAKVFDGHGKFLMPGLIDAHVHVETEALAAAFEVKTGPIPFADVLALYPAFGVTTVRVMSGAPDLLRYRQSMAREQAPVPRLIIASPMLAGSPPILPEPATHVVETAEAARAAVQEFARDGYDLIKIRENLKPEVLRATIAEARRLFMDVDGHMTRGLSVTDLVAAGQRGFAHLDEVARAMDGGARADAIARTMKAHGTYVSTAMTVLHSAADQIADYDRLSRRPEQRYLHPLFVDAFWTRARNPYLQPGTDRDFFLDLLAQSKRALKRLNDGGVRILAGTDAMNPMIIPGASLHDELQLMRDAGLSPAEALRTASVNPARVLRGLANAGAIAPGRDADLILIDANPFTEPTAMRRPAGVALRGRWFDRSALNARLEDVAARYHKR